MNRRLRWAFGLVISAGVALAAMPSGAAAEATPSRAAPPPSPAVVTLATGERVVVTVHPGGGTTASILPGAAGRTGQAMVQLGAGGHSYLIPNDALPYLGRGLDPSLFDVDALRAAETGGRLPLRITAHGSPPALPGVTASATDAYLTATSAPAFGAALAAQFAADRAARSFGGRGLFADGISIGLAGSSPSPPLRPSFVMHTLTVSANDASGRPDEGDVAFVWGVDDGEVTSGLSEEVNSFSSGSARFSVPDGHYFAMALFFDPDPSGLGAARIVTNPELSVSGDSAVRLDATQATSRVTMVTPRPSVPQEGGFELSRTARTGPPFWFDLFARPGEPMLVAPTAKPVSIGGLSTYPYLRLSSPPGPGVPYEYQIQKLTTGVIPPQRYVVRQRELATLDAAYYSDVSSAGFRGTAGLYPFDLGEPVSRPAYALALPRRQVEYVSADPSILWTGEEGKFTGPDGRPGALQIQSGRRLLPGERLRDDWNRFPQHVAGQYDQVSPDDGAQPIVPLATRSGDTLGILAFPFSDDQPGHAGAAQVTEPGQTLEQAYEVDANGVQIATGTAASGGPVSAQAALGAGPATIRLAVDAARSGPEYVLSTHVHTEWTWRSTHEQSVTLPAAYACSTPAAPPVARDCDVEPLLTIGYDVRGMTLDGSVRPGLQTLDLAVSHLQRAADAPVTGATVQFSTDDGATWSRAVTVRQGHGDFRARYAAPAGAGYVSLRVTATDATGGQIVETITRAYRVEGSA